MMTLPVSVIHFDECETFNLMATAVFNLYGKEAQLQWIRDHEVIYTAVAEISYDWIIISTPNYCLEALEAIRQSKLNAKTKVSIMLPRQMRTGYDLPEYPVDEITEVIWIHIPQELVFHADDFMGPLRGEYLVPTRPSKQEWAKLAACIDEPDDDKRAVLEAAFAKEMRENPIRYDE